MHIFEGNR